MKVKDDNPAVLGKTIDHQTRCIHYHTVNDIIAIKFKCCEHYYPCYECHQEVAGHEPEQWGKEERDTKAVLCGACGHELTINEYMKCGNVCPDCHAPFNPNCSKHYEHYFHM